MRFATKLATVLFPSHRLPQIDLLWEPRDLWVGVYWDRGQHQVHHIPGGVVLENYVRVYVCVLPCFPLLLSWSRPVQDAWLTERGHECFRQGGGN